MKTGETLIEFRNVQKAFGDCIASRDLSFKVGHGRIHGIIGENGAGKSTAMKMLFGLFQRDAGDILLDGVAVNFRSPAEAMTAGIGMVHQHFMLAGPFPAIDQLILAEQGHGLAVLDRKAALLKFDALATRYGFKIDLKKNVAELPVGAQQRLEILKVLARDPRILIFDEPTAVLTPAEVQDFFAQVRRLRDEGRTILIITHKLREIMQLTDEVTVFRQGTTLADRQTSETSAEDLAELMMGRKDRKTVLNPKSAGDVLMSLSNFKFGDLGPVNLQVRAAEIVGVAGAEGNGQDALIRALCEASRFASAYEGDGQLLGHDLRLTKTSDLRESGCAFFPEDRLRYGMLENRPARENFLLGLQNHPAYRNGAFVNAGAAEKDLLHAYEEFGIEPRNPDLALGRYSGGNQQKFVVARELSTTPKFILAAQPTRGVDLGAIRFIHSKILEARERNAGLLLISSEIEELMDLCDRIVVLYRGHIVAEFKRSEFDETAIGLAMGGKGHHA